MTANRLPFRVPAIRDAIERRLADEIAAAEAKAAKVLPYDQAVDKWRADAIKQVRSLASRFARGTVPDHELSGFSTPYAPHEGRYENMQEWLETTVAEAYARRDKALQRLDALRVYTPEGEAEPVLELTPAMARDWFGI